MANEPFNNLSKPFNKIRRYRKLKDVPPERIAEYFEMLKKMPDGNEKTILTWYLKEIPPRDIPKYCEANGIMSRCHTFYSARAVEYIVKKHFPDIMDYRGSNSQTVRLREHHKFAQTHKKEKCAWCPATEKLEWHHIKPRSCGGKTEEKNMICLCERCHKAWHRGWDACVKFTANEQETGA